MKRFKRYTAFLLMLIMVFALGLTGCGEAAEEQEAYATEVETLVLASEEDGENASAEDNAAQQNADEQAAYATETETAGADQNNNAAAGETAAAQNNSAAGETAAQDSGADLTDAAAETDAEGNPLLDESGSYYQKDEVALYIHLYGTVHQLDQLFGDGHAQAHAFSPGNGFRAPGKRLIEGIQRLPAHPDPGVLHMEYNVLKFLVLGLDGARLERDPSALTRKVNGI